VAKIQQEFGALHEVLFRDPKAGLRALKEFEAKYPRLANNRYSIRIKLGLLPKIGEIDEAKRVAEAAMAKAIKQENSSALLQVSGNIRLGPGKQSKKLMAVALQAAEAAARLTGEKDARILINLAETYSAIGDRSKAKQYARNAVKAAAGESAELRKYIEQQASKLDVKEQGKK
jgi:hypothetical protein